MKRLDARHSLAAGAAAFTIALTAAAFWLSYEHLHDVAEGNGLDGARAWAWPATIDLFIVVGELLILRASLAGRVDRWAVALTAAGSGGSIALNVAGVGTTAEPLEYIVAAVPPVAALLAFGALMRQVHEALAGHVAQAKVTTDVTVERADVEPGEAATSPVIELPVPTPARDDWSTSKVTAAVPAETTRQVVTEMVTHTPADLRREAKRLHRQVVRSGGRGVTIDQLRDELGLSRREAAELRREVVTEVAS
ncbi:DUF2637 domain-containing protein [Streptomyces sp. NPDC002187]|uniref:DUF2637 domain-containing protein n=1 Tax=Streptomyces sp. NPDC002187 TaxID=3364637 RepID=UPI0036C1E42E